MDILFIIIGLIIMFLTFKDAFKIHNEKILSQGLYKELNNKYEEKIDIIQNKLNNISDRIDDIYEFLSSDGFLDQEFKKNKESANFSEVYEKKLYENEYEDVYKEYMKGASITELARKFNREKGEIQLILSLKK